MLRRMAVAGLLAAAATCGFTALATAKTDPPTIPCIPPATSCQQHPAPVSTGPITSFPGYPWEWD